MPLFEYRCEKCGRRFSLLVGVTAEKSELRCPRCGSRKARKLISRIAPVVREDDWDSDLDDLGDDFDDEGPGDEDSGDDDGDDLDLDD